MASNSRLAIAIHTAGVLAFLHGRPVASALIARSVKTNPVVIRRIIGSLVKGGIVEVQKGTGGGSRLTRAPADISLAEIFLALGEGNLFSVPALDETHECVLGKRVRPVLTGVLNEAEGKLIEHLRTITLADVMNDVKDKLPAEFRRTNESER